MTGVQSFCTFSSDFYFTSQNEVDPLCYTAFMSDFSITSLPFSYMVFIFNTLAFIFAMLGIWCLMCKFFKLHLPLHVTCKRYIYNYLHTSHPCISLSLRHNRNDEKKILYANLFILSVCDKLAMFHLCKFSCSLSTLIAFVSNFIVEFLVNGIYFRSSLYYFWLAYTRKKHQHISKIAHMQVSNIM